MIPIFFKETTLSEGLELFLSRKQWISKYTLNFSDYWAKLLRALPKDAIKSDHDETSILNDSLEKGVVGTVIHTPDVSDVLPSLISSEEEALAELKQNIGRPLELTPLLVVNDYQGDYSGYWIQEGHITAVGFHYCDIEELPECILKFTNLKILSINNNSSLKTLPNEFGDLKDLEIINAQFCVIEDIPQSFGRLEHLQYCYLRSNHIALLPDSIGNLAELIHLELSQNELSELPETIGDLQELKTLLLDVNQLKTIPSSVRHLKSLREIRLGPNFPRNDPNLQPLWRRREVNVRLD
jgi:hypothetical protein